MGISGFSRIDRCLGYILLNGEFKCTILRKVHQKNVCVFTASKQVCFANYGASVNVLLCIIL